MSDCVTATGKTELEKLRAHEAKLEWDIKEEKADLEIRMGNLARMATQLSDCKKAIAELTVVKFSTAS